MYNTEIFHKSANKMLQFIIVALKGSYPYNKLTKKQQKKQYTNWIYLHNKLCI